MHNVMHYFDAAEMEIFFAFVRNTQIYGVYIV